MRTDNSSSRHATGGMSAAGPQPAKENRSEERYLADQAIAARRAMRQTVDEIAQSLRKSSGLDACSRDHPWLTLGGAIAAGFVTGAALTRKRPVPAESVRSGDPVQGVAAAPREHEPQSSSARSGLLRTLLGMLITGGLQQGLEALVTAVVGLQQTESAPGNPSTGGEGGAAHASTSACAGDAARPSGDLKRGFDGH